MGVMERGIILKKITATEHKFSVLSQTYGKVTLFVLNHRSACRLCAGSEIAFIPVDQRTITFATNCMELRKIPVFSDPVDMYWCHHLLELCYFFSPPRQPSSELFEFLSEFLSMSYLCMLDDCRWQDIKKVCVAVLLLLLGFYPPNDVAAPIILMHRRLTYLCSMENVHGKKIMAKTFFQTFSLVCDKGLDSWILQCIQSHPRMHLFKTINFMYGQ